MSINIGIVGLPQSGKTTVFGALTGGRQENISKGTVGPTSNVGVARVPEPRLKVLEDIFHPRKVVSVEVTYLDIGASVKSLAQEQGIGGELLNRLSAVDTLVCVVRAFSDESLPHPQGSLDVRRDIETLNLELVFSDLAIMERRLEKLESSLKVARQAERQPFLHEKEVMAGLKKELENDRPIRELDLDAATSKIISGYQFLTAKPLLIIVNIGEEQLAETASMETELSRELSGPSSAVIALCGKLELELARLEPETAAEFRADYGIEKSGLERTIQRSYEISDLITFFTTVSEEVRAWSVKQGTPAVKAAGKIHTDMEQGFIRAEVIGIEDLVKTGGIAEARKQGLLRLEGKDYIIRDGDVITFLFNV